MGRRITAALLAFMVLLSIVPTALAEEDNKIYDIGEDIWALCGAGGLAAEPTAETVENGYWSPVMRDGKQESEIRCPGIHTHSISCRQSHTNKLICGKEEHSAMEHISCSYTAQWYHWVVLEKEQTSNPGGDGSGDGLDSDGSGIDDELGDLNFVIENKDPDGNPVAGSQFLLHKKDGTSRAYLENQNAAQDRQTQLKQQEQEQQAKIKQLQEAGDQEALTAYLSEINEKNQRAAESLNQQNNTLSAKTTGTDGKVYFRALEKYLSAADQVAGEANPTWILSLVQSKVGDTYKPNDQEWEVKIVKTGEKTYSLTFTPDEAKYDGEGYQNGVLTFINESLKAKLLVNMKFVDQNGNDLTKVKADGESVLKNVTSSVTVTGPEDYSKTLSFPMEGYPWQGKLSLLDPGEYTLKLDNISGSVPGYTYQKTECTLQLPSATDTTATNTVELSKELQGATFILTHYYEGQAPETTAPTEEPEKPTEYTIIVKTVNEDGNPVTGATVALTGSGIQPSVSGNTHTFTISTDAVEAGDYVLQETKAPAGHELCEDKYTVSVKENGDVVLSKGNFIQRLFTRTNLADNGGTETIAFVHNRKTAAITLNGGVLVNVDPLCWNVEDTRNEFRNKKQDFVLEWTGSDGSLHQETLNLGQETKAFSSVLPYGTTYKVYPVNASGYSYSIQNVDNGTYTGTVGEKNTLSVEVEYTIVHGEALDLYFTKVAARTGKALAGAKFALNDANGQVLCYYTTKEGGAIDVEGMIDMPGNYTLKELKAPEEYDLLRKPIEITVAVDYQTIQRGGVPAMQQYLYEEVAHRSVVDGPDGTYWIKNTATADNPKTGDNAGVWMAVLIFSTLSLTGLTLGTGRRKHRR